MRHPGTGFTLIELLAALAVLGIVSAISVPSFAHILERQRLEAVMQRLETDLALARHTAMMRRQMVRVCPRSLDGECRPGHDWNHGWVVQVEAPQAEPLWVQPSLTAGGHPLALGSNRELLRYRPDGTSAGSNLTLSLCLRGQVVMQQIVSNNGRARRHQPEGEMPCPG